MKVKGVGLGCRILSGHGQGNRDFVADTRGLEMPWLAPRGLDPAHPSLVRLVIEDKNPAVGRLAIDLPLTAPPPWPVVAPIDVKQIVTPPAVNASQSGAAPLGLPARTLAAVIATAWLLLAVYTWRGPAVCRFHTAFLPAKASDSRLLPRSQPFDRAWLPPKLWSA